MARSVNTTQASQGLEATRQRSTALRVSMLAPARTASDGSTTTASDLNAAHNPFFRSFANAIVVSEGAQALPEMGGAGWVRDLCEAMSISEQRAQQQAQEPDYLQTLLGGIDQGRALIDVVAEFAAAPTKAQQMALLDELIRAWAASNQYVALKPVDDPLRRFVVSGNPEMSARLQAIVPVLEIFNGLGVAQAGMQNPTVSNWVAPDGSTQQVQTYTLFAEQVQPMLNAYEQLRQSVYGALVMQTRLKPYLDAVEVVIEEGGIRFDTVGITELALSRSSTDALNAITDVLELRRYGTETLNGVGWQFEETLAEMMAAIAVTPEITALLVAERMSWIGASTVAHTATGAEAGFEILGNALDNVLTGNAAGADRLFGAAGNDTLNAVGNSDVLDGGAGDDVLNANGTYYTTHIGGAGNDSLSGSNFADTYVFNRGDGADTITDSGAHSGNSVYGDRLVFGQGIADQDLWLSRSGDHLLVQVLGAGGQVQVNNWYSSTSYRIEELHLSDGQRLLHNQVDLLVQAMAAFAPPAPGQTTLTPEQQSVLAPVIAANWT